MAAWSKKLADVIKAFIEIVHPVISTVAIPRLERSTHRQDLP